MDSGSDKNFLILKRVIELGYLSPFSIRFEDGFDERIVSVLVNLEVDDFYSLNWFHVAK